MRFLLDTCVLSDFARGHDRVLERIKSTSPADLAISTVTEMEIRYGLLLNQKLARQLKPVMDALFQSINVLPFERAAAETAAVIRANLRKRGKPIGAYDLLIAGTAVASGLTIVTSNVREFQQIEGVLIENWRS